MVSLREVAYSMEDDYRRKQNRIKYFWLIITIALILISAFCMKAYLDYLFTLPMQNPIGYYNVS